MGGMIAAVGSIFITPWNLFNSPATIHYTLDILASFIGPLFGILLVDFFLVQKQKIDVNALYSEQPGNTYWYENGYNKAAIKALVPAALIGVAITFTPGLSELANFAWFIGCGVGGLLYRFLARCPDAIARMEPSRS
jgi:NCS1 family nucleobase:cation symporter-1